MVVAAIEGDADWTERTANPAINPIDGKKASLPPQPRHERKNTDYELAPQCNIIEPLCASCTPRQTPTPRALTGPPQRTRSGRVLEQRLQPERQFAKYVALLHAGIVAASAAQESCPHLMRPSHETLRRHP